MRDIGIFQNLPFNVIHWSKTMFALSFTAKLTRGHLCKTQFPTNVLLKISQNYKDKTYFSGYLRLYVEILNDNQF